MKNNDLLKQFGFNLLRNLNLTVKVLQRVDWTVEINWNTSRLFFDFKHSCWPFAQLSQVKMTWMKSYMDFFLQQISWRILIFVVHKSQTSHSKLVYFLLVLNMQLLKRTNADSNSIFIFNTFLSLFQIPLWFQPGFAHQSDFLRPSMTFYLQKEKKTQFYFF